MLLGNRSVLLRTPGRYVSGATISDNRSNWSTPSSSRTFSMSDAYETAGIPNAYSPPCSWIIPRKTGALATANQLTAAHALSVMSLALGRALSTTLVNPGSVTAQTIQRLLWIQAALEALHTVEGPVLAPSWFSADLGATGEASGPALAPSWLTAALENPNDLDENVLALVAWITASLEGGHALTPVLSLLVKLAALLEATGDVTGPAFMPASLSASLLAENDVAAAAGMLAWCASAMVHDHQLQPTDLHCFLWMTAALTSEGAALTAQTCAAAVWRAVATEFNDAGTMGEKLNDAGGAGNPWNTVLDNGLTAGEMMRLVLAMLGGNVEAYDVVKAFDDASKTRLTFLTDKIGNRTLVTFDPSD